MGRVMTFLSQTKAELDQSSKQQPIYLGIFFLNGLLPFRGILSDTVIWGKAAKTNPVRLHVKCLLTVLYINRKREGVRERQRG